jgi:PAS domain S-box-containing protein
MIKEIFHKLFKSSKNKKIKSEEIFQLISENAGDVFWILDTKKEMFSYVSPSIFRLAGYDRDEILKRNLKELLTPDSYIEIISKLPERISALQAGDERARIRIHEVEQVAKDGSIIPTEVVTTLLQDDKGAVSEVVGVSRDISRRKAAEELLYETQERFRLAFYTNPDSININRMTDGLYVEINEGFTQTTGYTAEEVIGKTSLEINVWYDPAQRQKMVQELLANGRVKNLEAKFRKKNGEVLTGLMSCSLIKLKGVPHILSITRDIERIKQFEAELISAKEKAQESDRLKTVFLQNMSHEIRTPMNAIIGFSDLLSEGNIDEEKILSYTSIIRQRSGDLLEIINEILDLSKIESGLSPIHMEACNFDVLGTEIYNFFLKHRERIDKNNIDLSFTIDQRENALFIATDKIKLKQIYINLITNAFKFTSKGKIEFGQKTDVAGKLIFFVSDTGIGIPKEKHNFIFQRFTQIDDGITRQHSGTGLGLAIVKGLLELMGGSIWLESEAGHGTTFYFTVPYEIINQSSKSSSEIKNSREYSWKNQNFLIVEDDEFNKELLKDLLLPKGAKLYFARTTREAVRLASSIDKLDLVLLDIRLPNSSGYAAINELKELRPSVKIMAQTAYANGEERMKAITAGCDDYISKPISKEILFAKIDGLIKGSG